MTHYVTFAGFLVPKGKEFDPANDIFLVLYSDDTGWKSVGTEPIEDLTDEEVESITHSLTD